MAEKKKQKQKLDLQKDTFQCWNKLLLLSTYLAQLVFKAVNNRKRSGYVDCQRGQID